MAKNDDRRDLLADAGLEVLAAEGARGLTHRAVDRCAGVPMGTTVNYFRTREDLMHALAERIFERLQPEHDAVVARRNESGHSLFKRFAEDVVRRLTESPQLTIALLELRLEATRNEQVMESLEQTMRAGFRADLAHRASEGLPGGETEVALLHYAINGLMLDVLTPSIGAKLTPKRATRLLVERLVADA